MKTVAENFKIIRTLPVRDREAEKSVGFTYRWEAFSFVLWLSHYSPENIQTLLFQHPTTPFPDYREYFKVRVRLVVSIDSEFEYAA